ncbi:MAG: leucine-rich repeat domain-containing protein [Flavobacteriales bacterium]|nr:leucine-rich repeat domain-containing protein [Flavobacteriales bacterium]
MRIFLLLLFCLASSSVSSQNWNLEALETEIYQYTSLEEALAAPRDSVYSLKLKDRLREVPPEVFTAFPNLQWLDLSKNRLTEIPKSVGLLKNLKKLILYKNKIVSLPAEIGELENLQELIINQNELESLPMEIGNLKKLRYLDMWSNNITRLPGSVAEMYALEEIDLRVIVMTQSEQEDIKILLPNVKVQMDSHCNCGN